MRSLDKDYMRKWMKYCALILAVLMLRVWENVQAQRLKRQVGTMRSEVDRLTYQNGLLQKQIHQSLAPSRLDAAAKERSMGPLPPERRVGIRL